MGRFDFPCPSCARVLKVSAEHIGRSGKCNHCDAQIVIGTAPRRNADVGDHPRALLALAQNSHSLEELIDGAYDFLGTYLECDFQDKAVLFVVDEQAGGLRLVKTRGQLSQEFLQDEAFVPLGECLCGRAAQSGQAIVCGDCFDDPRHDRRWLGMQTHGHYVIPLTQAGRVLGVLTLYTRAAVQADGRRMGLLQEVGEHAGKALQRLLSEWSPVGTTDSGPGRP